MPLPHPPFPNLTAATFSKGKEVLHGKIMLTQTIPADGFAFTSRRMVECQNGGENSNCSSTVPRQKLQWYPSPRNGLPANCIAFRLLATQLEWDRLMDCPTLPRAHYSKGTTFHQQTSEVLGMIASGMQAEETVALTKTLQRCVCPFWDASRGALQNSSGNSQAPLLWLIQSGNLINLENVGCGWGFHGPFL